MKKIKDWFSRTNPWEHPVLGWVPAILMGLAVAINLIALLLR